ncbi:MULTISPECIES: hypothetical protein [Halomonadaceae]|uniref:hypothetical protein n=1 Tax=Halomonadaceae TaxID=28256 RepID=UPI001598D963|nr:MULTISPECIES: hypothetical protein [Halomonas]QJQ93936.1 hypothetical protein HIO72_00575 [Halomonas sp. PA5]
MGTVTELRRSTRRLNNPESQLGRVHLVLRDATRWLQLHQISEAILARFGKMDSHAAISARIRELRANGKIIVRREVAGHGNTRPCEYKLIEGHTEGGDAA